MAYRITEEEYEEIKAAEKKTKDKRQSRQLKVLMLRYEGKSNPEISEKLDISTDRISHLISEFKRKGLGEYIKNKYKGNNRNMTYEEEEAILKRFSAAEEAGQIITVKEIKHKARGGSERRRANSIPRADPRTNAYSRTRTYPRAKRSKLQSSSSPNGPRWHELYYRRYN